MKKTIISINNSVIGKIIAPFGAWFEGTFVGGGPEEFEPPTWRFEVVSHSGGLGGFTVSYGLTTTVWGAIPRGVEIIPPEE